MKIYITEKDANTIVYALEQHIMTLRRLNKTEHECTLAFNQSIEDMQEALNVMETYQQ